MSTRTWGGRAAAGMLVALAGCAHHGQQAAAPGQPAQPAQQTAVQRANAEAAQADRAVADAQRRLDAAHQASVAAEQQRAQAQAKVSQAQQHSEQARQRIAAEQTSLQRAEEAARQSHAHASQVVEQAEFQAEQAQGLRSESGRIAQATPSRVVLETPDGRKTAFDVDARTRVLVGGEARSVADLQEGAVARVAYDPRSNIPSAVAIHVSPAQGASPPPPGPQQR